MIAPASRHLGKYEILRKLGRGGMADVYLAQDSEMGREVALKLIEHSTDQDTRDAITAERRGAGLQARLADIDPRVVKVYGCGDVDEYFFVAMEYIDGQDLADLMRRGPLVVSFAADVAIAVAETLQNAHCLEASIDGKECRGIVHGDIKPKNIRIDARGDVRVLDFGIAKALSLSRRLTRNEFGSVPYASPERLDLGEVNAMSDLWSLGVMLYEMTTGTQPYQAESTERLERMIRSKVAPPPVPDSCPEELRRILAMAMAPDVDARYQTAREFADALLAFRQDKPAPVPVVEEDRDATRRTWRPDDETRRTARQEPVIPVREAADDDTRRTTGVRFGKSPETRKTEPARPQPLKPKTVFGKAMRAVASLAIASVLYGAWAAYSSVRMYQNGQALEREIDSEQVRDPQEIFAKWTELSKGNSTSLLLYGPRKTVKQKLVDAADRVIAASRDANQVVHEKDWERARGLLADALIVSPDNEVRGKLRICDGYIARINGNAHKDAKLLQESINDFNEAAQLLPKSPDPELGLATVYANSMRDIDKASSALQEAAHRGYQLGPRETYYLASAYETRANRTFWDSRKMRGLPQERDQIVRVASDYKEALDLYQSIISFRGAIEGLTRTQAGLLSANTRIQEIDGGQQQPPQQVDH